MRTETLTMKKSLLIIFSSFMVLLLLWGCSSKEEYLEGEGAYPIVGETYIRLLLPSGTNVLDSLKVFNEEERKREKISPLDEMEKISPLDEMMVKVVRTSDGEVVSHQQRYFYTNPLLYVRDESLVKEEDFEVYLKVMWWDFKRWKNGPGRPYRHEDSYDIEIRSPLISGGEEIHTVRWYLTVIGGYSNAYKCEVDGKDVNLEDDPLYTGKYRLYPYTETTGHPMLGFITVNLLAKKFGDTLFFS